MASTSTTATPIFPDEFEDDVEMLNFANLSNTTKSEEENDKPPQDIDCDFGQGKDLFPSTCQYHLYIALSEWKKNSLVFKNCKHYNCDPLFQFIRISRIICRPCSKIRDALREQLIISWKPQKLYELLIKYIYFHMIKIFDPNAEKRYKNGNSDHPYYLAYQQVRKHNRRILDNFAAAFNFPQKLLLATFNHSFMGFKPFESEDDMIDFGYCQICQDSCYGITILYGGRYRPNLKMNDKTAFGRTKYYDIILCNCHIKMFNIYHKLTHMDWDLHWNCHLNVHHFMGQIQPNSDAAQIIEAIDSKIILELAFSYFLLYLELDSISIGADDNDRGDYGDAASISNDDEGSISISDDAEGDKMLDSDDSDSEISNDEVMRSEEKWEYIRGKMKDGALFQIISDYAKRHYRIK